MSETGDFDAEAFRGRLWDILLNRSIARADGVNAVVARVFADVTAVLCQHAGCTLGEAELLLADARSRADEELDVFDGGGGGAAFVEIDDATDEAVGLVLSMLNPDEKP